MRVRERRSWTKEEDIMLRAAIKLEEPHTDRPSKWHSIARHVPGRTNKDCRKRWCATMASIVSKGGWSSEEDRKLLDAVEKHGTKWSLVASLVETRNSGQCAKRWQDTLNPAIDRSAWSAEEDAKLLDAVENMGTCWTTIVKSYFPGRTALAAKNRYSHLNRSSSSKRSSSPSGSTVSSTPSEDPSSPVDLQDISSTDLDQVLTSDTSPLTSPTPSPVDPIEMVTDSPGSPDSLSSTGPPTPNIDTFDGKLLESLLQSLSPHTDLSDFKPSEFPFPFGSETTTITDELQNAPSFDATNLSCLTSPAFAAPSDQFSSWYQLNDLDLPSLETPPGVQTLPDASLGGVPASQSLQPDQQVAVAVAICRVDNLRPTVQVLIQSLAGALTQPLTSFPFAVPLTKVHSDLNTSDCAITSTVHLVSSLRCHFRIHLREIPPLGWLCPSLNEIVCSGVTLLDSSSCSASWIPVCLPPVQHGCVSPNGLSSGMDVIQQWRLGDLLNKGA